MDKEVPGLLVAMYLTEGNGSGMVTAGLLDAPNRQRWSVPNSSHSSKLNSGNLAASVFVGSLLGTSHNIVIDD